VIALIERINLFAVKWADAMSAVFWQATLLAAAVGVVCWALRRQSPSLRHWIWLILAAKLLVLPFWSVEIPLPILPSPVPAQVEAAPRVAVDAASSTAVEQRGQPASLEPAKHSALTPPWYASVTWRTWLLLLWAAVVVFEVGRTAWQYVQLRRLLAAARPVNEAVETLVADCARTLGLSSPPAIKQVAVDGSPLVCGPLRPVLLLPASHAQRFEAATLRQVVLHELAHLRRRDLLTIWVFHAMRTIYWFHPAAHWIAYRAGLDRELACDQLAMNYSGASPAAYARTLIHAAGRSTQPLVLSAAGVAQLDGGERLEVRE
jgi:beta-lactamase regulating signal transducer with metallopeptidase domain